MVCFIIPFMLKMCTSLCVCCVEGCVRNSGCLIISGCWDESLWVCDFTFYLSCWLHVVCEFQEKDCFRTSGRSERDTHGLRLSCSLPVLVWIARLWELVWLNTVNICFAFGNLENFPWFPRLLLESSTMNFFFFLVCKVKNLLSIVVLHVFWSIHG